MKLLLDIKDNKASFFLEVLKNFTYVKTTQLTDSKAIALKGFKEAVEEVKLAKNGNLETTSLNDFLDELPD